jgi:acyl dehydratase
VSLASLEGHSYGPVSLPVEAGAVADLVAATGGDPARWVAHAPPYFAAMALFAVSSRLLADPVVVPFTRSLIHTEQSFVWRRALDIGDELSVIGRVDTVRARDSLHLVSFDLRAPGREGPWLEARSVFLLSDEAAAADEERPEPGPLERGENSEPSLLPMPAATAPVDVMARSASRSDLVRYAGATRDWNPIHWDHEAARRAGFPGIVVHGLVMAAWLIQAGSRYQEGPWPLQEMRVRFRRPLHPGMQAAVAGTVKSIDEDSAMLDLAIVAEGAALVTASVRVTR